MMEHLEELALNAWPALQTALYDGWVMRFANGYTRRSNSILPLYPAQREAAEKMAWCESVYRERGLPVVFKLFGKTRSQELDAFLDEQGYRADAFTSMQTLDLSSWQGDPAQQAAATSKVILESQPTLAWQAAFGRMQHGSKEHCLSEAEAQTHQQLLEAIIPRKRFASVRVAGQVIGCGLGVAQDGFLGIFDIVIDPGYRRQGHGERLMGSLLAWGKQQAVHTAYLQVMQNNEPALRLYDRLGFREAYPYWYRVKSLLIP